MAHIRPVSVFIALVAVAVFLAACGKKGCIDPSAYNYDPKAKKDDNSCTYSSVRFNVDASVWLAAGVDSLVTEMRVDNRLIGVIRNSGSAQKTLTDGEWHQWRSTVYMYIGGGASLYSAAAYFRASPANPVVNIDVFY